MKLDSQTAVRRAVRGAILRAVAVAGLSAVAANGLADDFAGLADPTRPAYSAEGGVLVAATRPSGPMLQSTFVSASHRRAVISGKSYTVGDKFGGGTITDIQPYEVVVKKADRETRLRLLPKLVKEEIMVKVPVGGQEGGQNADK